jgi:hypothetical protein
LDTVSKQPQQQISVVESEEDPHEVGSRMMTISPTPERQLEEEEGGESTKESDKESDVDSLSDEGDGDGIEHEEDQISAMESLPPQGEGEQQVFTQQTLSLEGAESARSPGDMAVVDIEEQPQQMEFTAADRPEDDGGIPDSVEQLLQTQTMDTSDLTTQIPVTDLHSENSHPYSEGESDFTPAAQLPPTQQNIADEIPELKGENAMDLSLSEVSKPKCITIDRCPIAQCQRLYGCIQAAASRLEDATKDRSTQRISRLTKLIPRDPVEHIGKYI